MKNFNYKNKNIQFENWILKKTIYFFLIGAILAPLQAQTTDSALATAQEQQQPTYSLDPANPEDISDFIYYGTTTITLLDGNVVPVSLYRDPDSERVFFASDESTDVNDTEGDFTKVRSRAWPENIANRDDTWRTIATRPEYQDANGDGYVIGISINATNINATNPTNSGVSRYTINYEYWRVDRIAFDNTALGAGDRTDDTEGYLGKLQNNERTNLNGNPGKTVSFGDEDGDGDIDGYDAAAAIQEESGLTVSGLKQWPWFSGATRNSAPDYTYANRSQNNIDIPLSTTYSDGDVVYATVQDSTGTDIAQTLRIRAIADSSMATQDIEHTDTRYTIYPNPTTDEIHIDQSRDISAYGLYDMTGRQIMTAPMQGDVIDVRRLPAGAYMIVLETRDDHREAHKFIKK